MARYIVVGQFVTYCRCRRPMPLVSPICFQAQARSGGEPHLSVGLRPSGDAVASSLAPAIGRGNCLSQTLRRRTLVFLAKSLDKSTVTCNLGVDDSQRALRAQFREIMSGSRTYLM